MTAPDRWSATIPEPHPPANCGPLTLPLPPGYACPTCGTVTPGGEVPPASGRIAVGPTPGDRAAGGTGADAERTPHV